MPSRIPPAGHHREHLKKIIGGLSEGVVLIEPDQRIVWANDAALQMHGATKLEDLGPTAQDYCDRYALKYLNNHRVARAQYPIMRVLAGDEFTSVCVEVMEAQDRPAKVLQVRSLLLVDGDGDWELAVLIMSDITERINAEARFEKTFNANPAPAIICRLSDFRYIRVNQGFLDMTGYTRDAVLGRSAYEMDILAKAEHREQAIANIAQGHSVPQMEAVLSLPGGKSKYVIVAGQTLEMDDEACMLFTFIDLDLRKQTELALRQSEEQFSKAFLLAPVPMLVGTLDDFRLLEVNDTFLVMTGCTREELIDQKLSELNLWVSADELKKFQKLTDRLGSVRNHPMQLRTRDNARLDCQVSTETVSIDGERCVLGVIQDVTEHRQSENELIAAIETVMQDTSWFSRTVIEKLAQIRRPQGTQDKASELSDLTTREREVLGFMCDGYDDEQISEILHVSRNTVRNHIATIYSKVGVHRRSAAIIWGRERGVVSHRKTAPPREKD